MDDPNPPPEEEEHYVQPEEVWSQLTAAQQDRVVRLLSQMAYSYFAAKFEASAKEEGRDSGPSCSPSQNPAGTS